MKYVGSKNRISKQLAPIIQSYIDDNNIRTYWEPFVGGCGMMDKIKCERRIGSDIHRYLIALLKQAQVDTSCFPDTISEDEYKAVRSNPDSYPDWYVGLVGFVLVTMVSGGVVMLIMYGLKLEQFAIILTSQSEILSNNHPSLKE